MMLFHFCYDLAYIRGLTLTWFVCTPLQSIWRASISWVFLFIAGIMCNYSHNNFQRSAKYLLVAALIWIVTSYAMPSQAISFGIIYCMGASTLITACLIKALKLIGITGERKTKFCVACTAIFAVLFILCLQVPQGYFGFGVYGGPRIEVPKVLYNGWSSWLGFMSQDFHSADYYPIIPNTLLFLSGACIGYAVKLYGAHSWLRHLRCKPLEFVGQHALEFYILHQPVLLIICELIRF